MTFQFHRHSTIVEDEDPSAHDTPQPSVMDADALGVSPVRESDQTQIENRQPRFDMRTGLGASRIIGRSPAVRQALEQVQHVAATDSTVLLLGETGSGKEMFAVDIHRLSARAARIIVRLHCAAIPATLLESELFGRERGAYT